MNAAVETLAGVDLDDLRRFATENGWTEEDIEKTLHFIAHPTVRPVVGVREFFNSPHYMNALRDDGRPVIWPKVMDELEQMNSGQYDTIVHTGGIGSAKTTTALYSIAYQVYLLSCYDDPHSLYDLDPATEIVFVFQSVSAKAAKDVDYQRFRQMLERSPYFSQHFPFRKDYESEIRFPKNIIVRPVSSKDTGAIGQNVFGGLIDEVNFMQVIAKSKKAFINGEVYDQAVALYNSISKRRASRFAKAGVTRLPGLLCLVSSAKYPGQFTDLRIAERDKEVAKYGKSRIFVYNKRTWDVAPPDKFSGEFFRIFIGTATHRPRVLRDDEVPKEYEKPFIDLIPVEYRDQFDSDIMGSLRDIAGRSTIAKHPFFIELEKVSDCIGTTKNIVSKVRCTLVPREDEIEAYPNLIRHPNSPRFAHIDLAITGDSAALVIGHVVRFLEVRRGADQYETLPEIEIDLVLEIPPPKGGEVLFFRIRELLYNLKEKLGIPIRWVSLDSFQSKDTMQLLAQRGFTTGLQSIDTTNDPYVFLKSAFYDHRIKVPECPKLRNELAALEKDTKNNKIDHPPKGSKDIADALAGVVFGLTMRREVWAHFGVPLRQLPSAVIRQRLIAAAGGMEGAEETHAIQQDGAPRMHSKSV